MNNGIATSLVVFVSCSNHVLCSDLHNCMVVPMSVLTPEQVQSLLNQDKVPTQHTIQVGPVSQVDKEKRCVSRGCSSPTHWLLDGIPFCSTHLIDSLNERFIPTELTTMCTCKSGHYSRRRIHVNTCPVFDYLKSKEEK